MPAIGQTVSRHRISYKEFYAGAQGEGGARGSKGSFALQRSLSGWRRMRSTTRGSVINETMRMRLPHEHIRESAPKTLLIRRAHVLGTSLEIVLGHKKRPNEGLGLYLGVLFLVLSCADDAADDGIVSRPAAKRATVPMPVDDFSLTSS
jgi:hypothetical protein